MSEHRHDHDHDDDHGHHHDGHDDGHDHDHDGHDHGDHSHSHGSALSRITHAISEIFGWHSHDSADAVDTALEADARGRRALWISLAALLATSAVQAAIFVVTGSVALLGDTLHNVADALTAVPLLIAFWLVRKPANDRYTYGYGRAEDLAGLFVVVTVLTSAVLAAYTAVERLIHPATVSHLGVLAAGGLVGFLGNEFVARYRITVGRRIGSAALVADGLHARTDGFASLAVVISAGGLALGWTWADAVVGIVIAIAIIGVLKSVVQQVGARLLDAVDPSLVAAARVALLSVEEVQSVDAIKMRWVGHNLFAEADVTVPAHLSLEAGHNLAHHAEDHLMEALPRLYATTVHVIPAGTHA